MPELAGAHTRLKKRLLKRTAVDSRQFSLFSSILCDENSDKDCVFFCALLLVSVIETIHKKTESFLIISSLEQLAYPPATSC